MARSIEIIHQGIIDKIDVSGHNLSASKYAIWRLLTYVVASTIHIFEVAQDLFRAEIEEKAYTSAAGTLSWYAEICRQFQYGHTLVYNPKTAGYGYEVDDPNARIIKMVAINERKNDGDRTLFIKVAKQDDEGNMVPLSKPEQRDFIAYIDRKGGAGTPIVIISTVGDTIRYDLNVYYDPAYPQQTVSDGVVAVLKVFKTSLLFDAKLYPQQLIDHIMAVKGVVTVNPVKIEHKTSEEGAAFSPVNVVVELAAGYFEYDSTGCSITYFTV